MNSRLLKAKKLKELFGRIESNLELYRAGNFDFLKFDSEHYIETKHELEESKLEAMDCVKGDDREVENCKIIYEAMGDLSHYLARDERLWVYLTHTDLLEYSRKRWPIPDDDEKAVKHIGNHFFVVGGGRGFERDNAASRLWWMASLCSRVKGITLEETLAALLYQYDVRANIIERPTTSQSIAVFSAVMKKLHKSFLTEEKELFERERFRRIMRELNLKGGIKLLGAMDEAEVEKILEECISVSG